MVRRTAPVTGQLAFDDCTPDWPVVEPQPRRPRVGTRYRLRLQSDLWGQRLRISRIVTVPISQEYL